MKRILLPALGLSLMLTTSWATEGRYEATAYPDSSAPTWAISPPKRGNPATVELRDGALIATVSNGAVCYYTLGKEEKGEERGEWKAWDFAGDSVLVELTVRWGSESSEYEVFRVEISNGERRWVVPFFGDSLGVRKERVEHDAFDTYRLTLSEGLLTVSSKKRGTLYRNLKPYNATQANRLLFGSFWTSENQKLQADGFWELQSIRWTTDRSEISNAMTP